MNKDFNEIDQMAREALEGFEVDFNPADWELMEQKLDKKEHLMPYIWLYKGLEASVLLLLLFTGLHFMYQNNQSGNHQSEEQTSSQEYMATTSDQQADLSAQNLALNTTASEHNNRTSSAAEEAHHQSDNSNSTFNYNNSSNANLKAKDDNANPQTPKIMQHSSTDAVEKGSADLMASNQNTADLQQNMTDVTANTDQNNNTDLVSSNANQEKATTNEQNSRILSTEIAAIDLAKALADHNGGGDEDAISIKSKYKYPKIYSPKMLLSIFVGADYNRVTSEGIPQLGITFGAALETEINERFSLYYGLVATRKNFEDYYTHEIDRTATEGVIYTQTVERQASLSTIQVPLYFNTMLFNNAKWELNASVGLSGHLLATRYVKGTMRTSMQQNAGGLVNVSEINPDAQEKGAFQAGDIQRNIFATAGIALDLERQLSEDFKLFLHPQYQHALNPIGNNQDRLSSFSLLVGLKKAL
jgi:hypothetical protein